MSDNLTSNQRGRLDDIRQEMAQRGHNLSQYTDAQIYSAIVCLIYRHEKQDQSRCYKRRAGFKCS